MPKRIFAGLNYQNQLEDELESTHKLTLPIKPSMPMRSSIVSHKGSVDIIGEILNTTMLVCLRSLQEVSKSKIEAYLAVEPSTPVKEETTRE
jgi:hypothetical protein